MIYFTSDLHLCHDREFIYRPRGFDSVDEMDKAIVERWNTVVGDDDDVYVLGDLMLCDNEKAVGYIKMLKGRIHVILGNHDTSKRAGLYSALPNVVEVCWATMLRCDRMNYFLTHFPCITANVSRESLEQMTVSLFGHTHSKEKFYEGRPYMYNVAMDAHDCFPVSSSVVKADMVAEMRKPRKAVKRPGWFSKIWKRISGRRSI